MLRQFYAALLLLALFTACGEGDKERSDAGSKVFRYNMAEGLSSLDPAYARNQANVWAVTQLYSGLFELSNDMYTVPNLVDTWDISGDGKTYTFHLKKGVHFHDHEVFEGGKGRELKAEDFVYSFKRIVDPKTASTGAWIFSDKVVRNADGSYADNWVEATGDYSLTVRLKEPFGPFLEVLSMPYTYVVPREAVEKYGKDFRVHPVGTGPFAFKSWSEGNNMILLKNENYWRSDENGVRLPYMDAIQVSFINDRNQELLTFQQHKLDFMSGVQANSIDKILNKDGSIKDEFSGTFEVQKVPYLNTEYIGFQMDKSKYEDENHPIFDKRFRQAMNYAINREEMIAFMLNNLGKPGTSGIIPPAVAAFNAEKVKGYTYNPKKAEELLKSAGYPGGKGLPQIELYTTAQSKPFVEYLQKQWAAVGIDVAIHINQAAQHQELIDNSKVKFFRGSWLGDYPDAENYLSLFYSGNFSPAGPNKTHFKNAKFDELYEKARKETEGFKRYDIYSEMEKIIIEEAPVIVLFYDEVLRLTQNNLANLETNPMNVLKLERANFYDKPETKTASTKK